MPCSMSSGCVASAMLRTATIFPPGSPIGQNSSSRHTGPLKLASATRKFITYIDEWNVDRYFLFPYGSMGVEIIRLDWAVWDIRRYCIPYHRGTSPNQQRFLEHDLKHIEAAVHRSPQRYRSLSEGLLEKVLEEKDNSARPGLVWNNMYFGPSRRKSVHMRQRYFSHNSPLALYPQILDEVAKFVYLPKDIRP